MRVQEPPHRVNEDVVVIHIEGVKDESREGGRRYEHDCSKLFCFERTL